MKVYKLTDRVKLKIDDVVFEIAPLSYSHKLEMAGCVKFDKGVQIQDFGKQMILGLKYGLKSVEGLEYSDGTKFELKFDETGVSDDCLSELMLISHADKLLSSSLAIVNTMRDPQVEGVTVTFPNSETPKKKSNTTSDSSSQSSKK